MADFNIGDRVEAVRDCPSLNQNITSGMTGTVCRAGNKYSVGVCWDDYVKGHDCDGLCEMGHGWYIRIDYIKLIQESDFDFDAASIDKLFRNLIERSIPDGHK